LPVFLPSCVVVYVRRKKEVSSPTPFRVRTAFKAGLASSPVLLPSRWSVRESNPLRRDLQSPALPIELTDQTRLVDKLGVAPSHSVCKTEHSPLRQARVVVVRVSGALRFASLKQPSVQRILRVGPRTTDDNGGRQRTRTSRGCPRESRSRRSSLPANLPSVFRTITTKKESGQDGGIRTCVLQSPRLALLPG
jgi:hypothetical protein